MLALHLCRERRREITGHRRDAAPHRDFAHFGRLDAEHAMAAVLEIAEQRAVVRAEVDHEVALAKLQHGRSLAIEIGEIVAQELRGAAGVGIFRRKDDDGIDRQAELGQVAI